jgi:hypothetical protein
VGFAPPLPAPSPSAQASASADVSFAPAPAGPSLCGFALPGLSFGFAFHLPAFPPFPFPPTFDFFVGLQCDLSNPIAAKFGFGGGRASQLDPDSDPDATADL